MKSLVATAGLLVLLVTPALAAPAEKITICHHTGSATNPLVTITISGNAWPAHERHGDTVGPCQTSSPAPSTSANPSVSPSVEPSVGPSVSPSVEPSTEPSIAPSPNDSQRPEVTPPPTDTESVGATNTTYLPFILAVLGLTSAVSLFAFRPRGR